MDILVVFLIIFQQFSYADGQAWVDSDRDILVKGIDHRGNIFFIMIDSYSLFCRIYDPVLPYTVLRINSIFNSIIQSAAGWRYNFKDKIRSPGASAAGQLNGIADHGNIRFDPITVIGIQINGKRSRIYTAVSIVIFDIVPDFARNLIGKLLMQSAGWCHVVKFSINEFGTFSIGQIPVVF